jgi:rod shape-determining protein MreD
VIFTYIITALFIIISLLIQGHHSFDIIRINGVKPDLVFIVVVYTGYSFGSFYGEVTGFTAGLLHDAVSRSPLGFLAFPKMVIGYVVGMFSRRLIKSHVISIIVLVFVASIIKGGVTLVLAYVFHNGTISMVKDIILPEAFYNALVSPLIFVIMDKIFEKELEREGF